MALRKNHLHCKSIQFVLTVSIIGVLSTACSQSGQFPTSTSTDTSSTGGSNTGSSTGSNTGTSGSSDNTSAGLTTPNTSAGTGSSSSGSSSTANPGTGTTPSPTYKMTALAWETSAKPERTQWSLYLQDIILNKWNSLLAGADDIESFCPKYHKLDNNQRANVWAALFVGVAKYESGYSPTSRYQESTMGTDPITRQPVWSEGLLQLSYQDIQGFPFCEFDWSKDKSLSATDPKKTILDPYKNLDCGVGIMAKQISRKGLITVSSGAYWSTLKSGGRYQQISGIEAIVKKLPFCN